MSPSNNEFMTRIEAIKSIESDIENNITNLLNPIETSWQPADFLPNLQTEQGVEEFHQLRERAQELPDELIISLVGDMITEEALPTYMCWFGRLEGFNDSTGTSDDVWARWIRGWTCEENRHGDLLSQYLMLSGRVDMKAIQVTIQHLINNGFNSGTGNDPYLGFVYTSFQERATKASHRNTGRLAAQAGDKQLQRICAAICADEKRHEEAYQYFITKLLEVDPNGIVLAFEKMMRHQIAMPSMSMFDGKDTNLYTSFSKVAQKAGVYTAKDYAGIVGYLVEKWNLANLKGLSNEAEKAREFLCKLAPRYERLANRAKNTNDPIDFSWINGKTLYA